MVAQRPQVVINGLLFEEEGKGRVQENKFILN